jgi:hypothetical protein
MIGWSEARGAQAKKVIDALLASGAWKATLILSPTEVVRATRRWYRRRKTQDQKRVEVAITIGRPNYQERDLVRACMRAGEQFPVKKVQLKFRKGTQVTA